MSWVHSLQSWDYFSQILPHYHHNFHTFAWLAVYRSQTFCCTVEALHACCVSARRRRPQPSEGKKDGRQIVVSRNCRENEVEQIQGGNICGSGDG